MKKIKNNLKYKYEFKVTYDTHLKYNFYVYVFEESDVLELYIQEQHYGIIQLLFGEPIDMLPEGEILKILYDNIYDYVIDYMQEYMCHNYVDEDLLEID